jgi:hypothetical protein
MEVLRMIHLQISNKKISVVEPLEDNFPYISCNASYSICFTFDEEWKDKNITAMFVHKNDNGDKVPFEVSLTVGENHECICAIPSGVLSTCGILFVGAYAGEIVSSNFIRLYIRKSIKDVCGSNSNNDIIEATKEAAKEEYRIGLAGALKDATGESHDDKTWDELNEIIKGMSLDAFIEPMLNFFEEYDFNFNPGIPDVPDIPDIPIDPDFPIDPEIPIEPDEGGDENVTE